MRTLTAALALALLPAAAAGAGTRPPEWLGPPPPAVPRRVVSLAPSLTDTVVALGLASRLVGVTRYDHDPAVDGLTRVGGFLDPSVEVILGLKPDLVLWLTDRGAKPAVTKLADLGIPVRAIPVVNVADTLVAARQVAAALGDVPAGERLAASLQASMDRARASAAGRRPVRVLFVIGREPLVVAGPGSYPAELLGLAGAVNVVEGGQAWPVFPLERAVALDPELVLDAAFNEPARGIDSLEPIPAVRRGAIHRFRSDAPLRPGPRMIDALDELQGALETARAAGPAPRPKGGPR